MLRSSLFVILASIVLCCAPFDTFGQRSEQRLWKDTTGKFQIHAALIEQTASAVRLRTADGREVSVPIQRLSQADQDYLKSLNAPADNPFSGGAPASGAAPAKSSPATGLSGGLRAVPESKSVVAEMELPGTGTTLDLSSAPAGGPFVPDPCPDFPALAAAVVPLSAVDAYDNVSSPVPANLAQGRFLVSIGRNVSGRPQETRGRIYSVSLAGKKPDLVWDHPRAVRVWDYDAASGRTLIVDNLDQFERGGELVMVEGLEKGNPAALYRRTLPGAGKPGFDSQVKWARLLSGSHVAAIVDNALYVWDLPAAKLLYRVEQVNAIEPPVFSGNQIMMAIPQNGRVVIVETASGRVCKSIATGNTLEPGVAFNRTGRLLAICFSNQYLVWDCVADKVVRQATTTEHLGSHPVHWIAPKMLLTALSDAVHLDLGMCVWKYTIMDCTERILVGNMLLTVTTSEEAALACVEIPHASAQESIDRLMRAGDAAMLVRPGSAVAVAIETTEQVERPAIQASISQAAERAGWKVNDRAPITLVAKIGRGKTRQLQYHSMGGGSQTTNTATLTPFTVELEIRSGNDVLWTRSSFNQVPMLLLVQGGETVQDAVKRFEKPDPEFFASLALPPRIPKPEIKAHVGMSALKDAHWQDLNINAPRRPRTPAIRPRPGRSVRLWKRELVHVMIS
ncbi:MAG: SHD1 domain-containing protein [Thermoguttaceae bacterium]